MSSLSIFHTCAIIILASNIWSKLEQVDGTSPPVLQEHSAVVHKVIDEYDCFSIHISVCLQLVS